MGRPLSRALLLSIKPAFARAILDGRKTAEVRRRFPSVPEGTEIFLYSSSPERAVLGTVTLRRTIQIDPGEVWGQYASKIVIDRGALEAYLRGATSSTILEVEHPDAWPNPMSLARLRSLLSLEPPQSFRYLASSQVAVMQQQAHD